MERLRNRSSKSIRFFTVVSWSPIGGGGTLGNPLFKQNRFLLPQQTLNSDDNDFEIISLTDQIKEKLKLERGLSSEGRMKNVHVLVVEKVIFSDGSIYSDEQTSQALKRMFSNMDSNTAKN